jgi:hypothetical protein
VQAIRRQIANVFAETHAAIARAHAAYDELDRDHDRDEFLAMIRHEIDRALSAAEVAALIERVRRTSRRA